MKGWRGLLAVALTVAALMPAITFFWGRDTLFAEKQRHEIIRDNLISLYNRSSDFSVKVWTDRETYKIGDPVRVFYTSEKNCYISIIDLGTSGNLRVLYPNRFSGGNKIEANKVYEIPGSEAKYEILADGPPGEELLKIIATADEVESLDLRPKNADVFREFSKETDEPLAFTKNLRIKLKSRRSNEWSEDFYTFTVH